MAVAESPRSSPDRNRTTPPRQAVAGAAGGQVVPNVATTYVAPARACRAVQSRAGRADRGAGAREVHSVPTEAELDSLLHRAIPDALDPVVRHALGAVVPRGDDGR